MKFLLFILFTGIPVKSHPGGIGLSGCGTPGIPSPSPCTYSPYGYGQIQPQPQPMPTGPAVVPQYQYPYGYPQYQVQQVQYYYPAQPAVTSNAYVTAPPSSNSAVEAFSKDSAATIAAKQPLLASFEEYEKKLKELEGVTQSPEDKAVSEIISNTTLSPVTYIKEAGYLTAPPTPSPYLPRPLPYRPHPYLPTGLIFQSPEKAPIKSVLGCPVLPPQYLKPIPYYPRGYVQPIPLPTQISQPGRSLGFFSRKFDFQLLYPIPIHPTINLR
ncbi:hypothetical protein WR25_11319 isoform C [Diploscapter pachys]|uniref:SXP/RAL-2 family protein Ani s 5-like cation-binding domain-containing protein n=1 Tax=Diploscapter pachys TaxID=2018661 RepID=A0A2A2JIQ1_9BILA|nr:hypothetical protein WR25_11319 isoform A [Diploscapter pachys]PAV61472.1 hypothetical protein WR25_11319 isoform B [Diploscapter pachys]PAV61473.1 hypothetical protein WR25_11319 isoform C [Diploscapter pachys]